MRSKGDLSPLGVSFIEGKTMTMNIYDMPVGGTDATERFARTM